MNRTACIHLKAPEPELSPVFVLDTHLHMTDGFVRCPHCDAHYLLEMLDLTADTALYRISRLAAEDVARTVRSLTKGSCDINRARDEVFSIANGASKLDVLLVAENGHFTELVPAPDEPLPAGSWRDLPCDGRWIRQLTCARGS